MAAGTTVGEFVLDLIVDAGKGELTISGLVAQMGELELASVGEIAILFELGQKLAGITDHAIQTTLGLEHLTSSTGMSTKALQEWANVAEYVGISGSTVTGVLAGISHNLAMGKFSGDFGGLKNLGVLLEKAGLSLDKFAEHADKPEELLMAIRNSEWFQEQSKEIQYTLLSGSGIQEVLELLQKSRINDADMKRYLAEGPIISADDLKSLDHVHRVWTEIKQVSEETGEKIATWSTHSTIGFFENVLDGLKAIGKVIEYIVSLLPGKGDEEYGKLISEMQKNTPSQMVEAASGLLDAGARGKDLGAAAVGPVPVWEGGLLPGAKSSVTYTTGPISVTGVKGTPHEVGVQVGKGVMDAAAYQDAIISTNSSGSGH